MLALLLALATAAPGRAATIARTIEGTWQAGAPVDPANGPLPDPAALRRALDFADLPRPGETVSLHAHRMCVAREPCIEVTWQAETLATLLGGGRLADDFHLPRSTRAWLGSGPNPHIAITLVVRPGERLLAVVPLCDAPPGSACRNGYQPWTPAPR